MVVVIIVFPVLIFVAIVLLLIRPCLIARTLPHLSARLLLRERRRDEWDGRRDDRDRDRARDRDWDRDGRDRQSDSRGDDGSGRLQCRKKENRLLCEHAKAAGMLLSQSLQQDAVLRTCPPVCCGLDSKLPAYSCV